MITYVNGNLFESPAHVLVNTVNTVGVMGKGVAKDFKRLFPDMFHQYQSMCESKRLQIGTLFLYKSPNKWVLNFPTKQSWRNPSRVEFIESGLKKLVSIYSDRGISNLAMPLIGCGNGELDWRTQVGPLVEKHLSKLPIDVFVYSYPVGSVHTPEHRDVVSMRKWLNSEPEHLPFSEVWRDLKQVLEKNGEFQTLAGSPNTFTAASVENPEGVVIQTYGKNASINVDEIRDFWHQIRSYGFTSRQIAPSGLSRNSSYLMPIFAELDYTTATTISSSYDRLRSGLGVNGLQYIPRPPVIQTPSRQFTLAR